MKKILIIVVSLYSAIAYSQEIDNVEWCSSGATWVYSSNEIELGDTRHFRLYNYEKDTVVNNLNVKKINKYSFNVILTPANTKIRTKNEFIVSYYFYNSGDSVSYLNATNNLEFLYTFSDILGASWFINNTNNSLFDDNFNYPILCDSITYLQDQVTINAIKKDTINNVVFQSTILYSSFSEWGYGNIYKNIGPSKSFFATPNYSPKNSCNQITDFNGYYKENELVYYYDDIRKYDFNDNSDLAHYFITAIKDYQSVDEFILYPNPVSDFINLSTTFKIEKLYILDYKGSVIEDISIDENNRINIDSLDKGVYYVCVQGKENKLIKKIIKF